MAQVLGIADIIWKGAGLNAQEGATFRPGGIQNKTVKAGRQGHRAQEFDVSEVKATIVFKRGDNLTALLDTAVGELQFVTDVGTTFVLPEAWIVGKPTLTGGDGGKLELTWNASGYEESV